MIALLVIGDEILSSQVRDENLTFMIRAFSSAGYDIGEARIVRDDIEQIAQAFRDLAAHYDFVVSSGGVGPTHDDVTLMSVARAFDRELELNQDMLRFLTHQREHEESASIRRMASMPVGTKVMGADDVHWPIIQYANCYILPGLPVALRAKVDRIVRMLPVQTPNWVGRIFLTVDESNFAELLSAFQAAHPDIVIGSYPVVGMSTYRAYVTIKSRDAERVREALSELIEQIGPSEWIAYTEEPRKSGELFEPSDEDQASGGGGSSDGSGQSHGQEQNSGNNGSN